MIGDLQSPISHCQSERAELQLRPFHPTDLRPLQAALVADGVEASRLVLPTHVLERNGQIVGYGSGGPVVAIFGWSAPSVNDQESLAALQLMEQAAAAAGAQAVVITCTDDCRFKPFLTRTGYIAGDPVQLFYKKVRQPHG